MSLFLSLIALSLIFSSAETSFGIEALLEFGAAFFGRSLIWPTLDSTIYSDPRYFEIVLAFAGDSTITNDFDIFYKLPFLWISLNCFDMQEKSKKN